MSPPRGPQVIFALPPTGDTDYSMRLWNSDGSEPEMCGNGIRCLARFVAERDGDGAGTTHRIHTLAGADPPATPGPLAYLHAQATVRAYALVRLQVACVMRGSETKPS